MLRIEKFLTIFELETGGKIIGHFGFVICSLILTLSMYVLTKVFTDWELVEETFHSIQMEKDLAINPSGADMFRHTLTASLISMIFLQIISLISFILLLRGCKNRNPKQINPSVLLFLMFTVLAFIALLNRFPATPGAIVNFVFYFYLLVVLFSLKKKFQEEQQGKDPFIYQPQSISDYTVMHHQQKA